MHPCTAVLGDFRSSMERGAGSYPVHGGGRAGSPGVSVEGCVCSAEGRERFVSWRPSLESWPLHSAAPTGPPPDTRPPNEWGLPPGLHASSGPSLRWFDTWGAWFRTPVGSASSTGSRTRSRWQSSTPRALAPRRRHRPSCPHWPLLLLNVGHQAPRSNRRARNRSPEDTARATPPRTAARYPRRPATAACRGRPRRCRSPRSGPARSWR
jgi:hypothetical protein